jgi:hypothetical protein
MSNADPNHVKGSHPNQAKHAAEGIRYVVLPADAATFATQHEARQAGPAGGTLFRTEAVHNTAPAATPAASEPAS